MILLNVKDYCHTCDSFEPIVEDNCEINGRIDNEDKVVVCRNCNICNMVATKVTMKAKSKWNPGCVCRNCLYEARFVYKYCPSCGAEMEDGCVGYGAATKRQT